MGSTVGGASPNSMGRSRHGRAVSGKAEGYVAPDLRAAARASHRGRDGVIFSTHRVARTQPNRSAAYGAGSMNGVAPVIISAMRRPVTGPNVSPQWAWP